MNLIEKYKELLNSPEVTAYIGNSARRRFLVHGISGFVVVVLGLLAIFLISAGIRVLTNYLF
jgi:hypothetical protein